MSSRPSRMAVLTLCLACLTGWGIAGYAADPAAPIGREFVSGVVGGLGGAVLAVISIEETAANLESRLTRTAMVIGSVTVLAGGGASVGVLACGKLLDAQGNVPACFLGGFIGGFASMWVEPLLYTLHVPEGITEFIGMMMLPIGPAIGATLGFNQPREAQAPGA